MYNVEGKNTAGQEAEWEAGGAAGRV